MARIGPSGWPWRQPPVLAVGDQVELFEHDLSDQDLAPRRPHDGLDPCGEVSDFDRRAAPVVDAEPAGPVASHGPHRDLLPRLEPDSGVEPGHGRGDLPLAAVVGVGSEPAAVGERTRR